MENVKHTPGPWKRGAGNDCHEIYSETSAVCSIYGLTRGRRRNPRHGEANANTRLIAAAPEMLEVLQGCLSCLDFGHAIQRVIAKG